MRFLIVAALVTLAACAPAEPVRTVATRERPHANITASARQVLQNADCEADNPGGLYLVRVGDDPRNPGFYAMAWRSRPPTPQAVSMSCLLDPREPGTQAAFTARPDEDRRSRRLCPGRNAVCQRRCPDRYLTRPPRPHRWSATLARW